MAPLATLVGPDQGWGWGWEGVWVIKFEGMEQPYFHQRV